MSPDPDARDRAVVINMARTLARLKSPLGRSDLARWEARADLLDSGYSAPAVDRLFDRVREEARKLR